MTNVEDASNPIETLAFARQAKKRAWSAGFFVASALPIIVLEYMGMQRSWSFLIQSSFMTLLVLPVISYIAFLCLQRQFQCPKCMKKWTFLKSSENVVDAAYTYAPEANYRYEKYITEYKCTQCTHRKIKQKVNKNLLQ